MLFFYYETAENIEDKILKIFKKYLEEVMKQIKIFLENVDIVQMMDIVVEILKDRNLKN